MEKLKNPKIGDKVIGYDSDNIFIYTGTIMFFNNKQDDTIEVLRDDKTQGSGREYKGKYLWNCQRRSDDDWGADGSSGIIYLGKIENWKRRIK